MFLLLILKRVFILIPAVILCFHCVAGVCRSGAVAEVGTMLGFTDTETFRIPNVMVKRKLIQQLESVV